MSDAIVLSLKDVEVSFGGVVALRGVDLDLVAGQVCGLVGPNGSGKTTLLGVVSGLVTPTAGVVELAGRRLRAAHPADAALRGVSRTFQNLRLAKELTVLENVAAGAGAALRRAGARGALRSSLREREIRARSSEALERVGLGEYGAWRPDELPYGFRRRVEIARALAMEPQVLLLDEPAAGMTATERTDLLDVFRDIARDGITQVLVEHDFGMISSVCERVVVLTSGRVIADGPPHHVASLPEVQEAYLGRGRRVDVDA